MTYLLLYDTSTGDGTHDQRGDRISNGDKTMWLINAGAMTVQEAVSNLGLTPHILLQIDDDQLEKIGSTSPR
jgi:hypothetical protein